MITLTLPAPLASFMPHAGSPGHRRPRSVLLTAQNWTELIAELRGRFPLLAEHVLTASDALAAGVVLVINDEAMTSHGAGDYDVHDGDEIALISAIAGG
jgi:molybdopterin converting factor small subunit